MMDKQETSQTLIKTEFFPSGNRLPLIIQPAAKGMDLVDWAGNNRAWIETELQKYGGILFRGFDVSSESEFKQFAVTICPEIVLYANFFRAGDKKGNHRTAATYPANKKITVHNEDNPTHSHWPKYIMFYCFKPAEQGGETPIVDCRRVFERIEARIRQQFIEKGILYVNNYSKAATWQSVFGASEKSQVQEYCRKALIEFEWLEGGRLRTRYVRPAVVRHPETGEMIWFNFAHLNHLSLRNQEERRLLLLRHKKEDLPTHCFYGDGTEIEDFVMNEISDVYDREEVVFPWQEKDILLLDNMLAAHGRNPFVGTRQHYVAMSSNSVNYFDLLAEDNQPNPELVTLLQKMGVRSLNGKTFHNGGKN